MKQLLFLFLFPCLAMAQYTGNGNQKITLGEQTTADGLLFRGLASIDTVTATSKITRANKQDTSAFILLDTVTNLLWHYKTGSNKWIQAGGGTSVTTFNAGTTGLTPSTATSGAVTLSGTLAVANGGTGSNSFESGNIPFSNSTLLTSDTSLYWDNINKRLGIGTKTPSSPLSLKGRITMFGGNDAVFFSSNGVSEDKWHFGVGGSVPSSQFSITQSNVATRLIIINDGDVLMGYTADNGAYKLQVNGQIFATNATIATSDKKFKENIAPLNKGLEIVNKLKPVTFNFISNTENNFSEYEEVGFIAQDVDRALSTETFAKSIVKSADDSEPTSSMGLATQNLIPILVKAIQEQQVLIKALEQRILILENK